MRNKVIILFLFVFVGCGSSEKIIKPAPIEKECKPEVIIQERILIEEQPIIQEKIVYKDKIIYKDKIVYKDKIIYKKQKKQKKQKTRKTPPSTDKPIIGRVEYIKVVSTDILQKAKIDTGAKTTSIDAKEIVRFERDGKEWVKFKFAGKSIEKPLLKNILIKRHGVKSQRRAVIQLRLKLGKISRHVNVTLTDREEYIYPILIGRNFLKDAFIVDVSQTYTVDKKISNRK